MAKSDQENDHGLLRELRPHAVWDGIKAIVGGCVPPLTVGITEFVRHQSVDFWGLSVLGIITAIAVFLLLILRPKGAKPEEKSMEVPSQLPSRLKIISAHYGVAGIAEPEVTHYLLERLHGNSFAELIVADLFHGFDPISNKLKSLKVRYSFDGIEATITRPEYATLILPEDKFLKEQLEACERQSKLNENQFKSDLWRANESRRQCEEERRAVVAKVEEFEAQATILSPLQRDALSLRKKLIAFLHELGPEPTCDPSDCLNDPTLRAKRLTEWHKDFSEFKMRLKSLYAVRFRQTAVEMHQRFILAGIRDFYFGELSNAPLSVNDVRKLTTMLWLAAGDD